MANPQKLDIPQLGDIHITHPPIGKALAAIVEYVNRNVTPVPGTKVTPRKTTPGGNP